MQVQFVKEYVQSRLDNLNEIMAQDLYKSQSEFLQDFYTAQVAKSKMAISELESVLNLLEQC